MNEHTYMTDSVIIFPEPSLEFRYGQGLPDPRDGLSLFGPYDADSSSRPGNITYGVFGTPEGIGLFEQWSILMNKPSLPEPEMKPEIWRPFPGFEAVFDSTWSTNPTWTYSIDREGLLKDTRLNDRNKRAFAVVDRYLAGLQLARKRDESFDLFVCIIPDKVWENCQPESRVIDGIGSRIAAREYRERLAGQQDFFDEFDPRVYTHSVDFRRQLKARAMEFNFPLQIVRESTLKRTNTSEFGERGLTPLPDRAWNLSTTLYYKSGGKPWRLLGGREGVCYVGIAFRKTDLQKGNRTACCAAQMFLDSGDGIVFLGEYGPWYSPKDNQFHLTKKAARQLLTGVLNTYNELHGKPLREIFLHSRSQISEAEFAGYKEACPTGVDIIGIRVCPDRNGVKLFREGTRVVLRGTFWKINSHTGFLCASGFKPSMKTYDGWEIPIPLRINIQQGEADIEQVARDIFSLTKLNYNACRLGQSQPVTIGFSDAVGEILVSNPNVSNRRPNFKFYI